MRLILAPALALALLLPGTATAAERKLYPSSFDRVRVQGPYLVRIATGRSPGASVSGDPDAIEGVELRVDGTTLAVRGGMGRWEERPQTRSGEPIVVTLSTPSLAGVSVIGQGEVSVDTMKGDRVDLSVTGSGVVRVGAVDSDSVNATAIGNGGVSVGGRAGKARLIINGPGTIDAGSLDAGEVFVRVDGPGEAKAQARFTATVFNTGLGRVAIAGSPKCVVKADAGGPVTCGAGR